MEWTRIEDLRDSFDEANYLLSHNGQKLAMVYFIGGHVERPDAWQGNRTQFWRLELHGSQIGLTKSVGQQKLNVLLENDVSILVQRYSGVRNCRCVHKRLCSGRTRSVLEN